MASEMPPKQTSAMRSFFSRKTSRARRGPFARTLESCREKAATKSISCRSLHHGCGIDPHRLEAVIREDLEDVLPMRSVARFHRDVELGALGRHVEEEPVVLHAENVGAELAEPGGDLPEHSRLVGDGQPEGDDAAFALELAHHHGGENARVDIAAAQDQPDLAAAEFFRL